MTTAATSSLGLPAGQDSPPLQSIPPPSCQMDLFKTHTGPPCPQPKTLGIEAKFLDQAYRSLPGLTSAYLLNFTFHPPHLCPELQLPYSLAVFLQYAIAGSCLRAFALADPVAWKRLFGLFIFLIPYFGFLLKWPLLREAPLTPRCGHSAFPSGTEGFIPSAAEKDVSCQPSAVGPLWELPQLQRAPRSRSCPLPWAAHVQ